MQFVYIYNIGRHCDFDTQMNELVPKGGFGERSATSTNKFCISIQKRKPCFDKRNLIQYFAEQIQYQKDLLFVLSRI